VQRIKIDRSFVRDIGSDPDDEAVVRAIVTMAHTLGKEVVAEGVETPAQLAFLRMLGCDAAQGFLLGRPTEAGQIAPLLAA
jgi:EAL domain-containing protein (putative c-di-GMP-specific phosphodiesterase class I)